MVGLGVTYLKMYAKNLTKLHSVSGSLSKVPCSAPPLFTILGKTIVYFGSTRSTTFGMEGGVDGGMEFTPLLVVCSTQPGHHGSPLITSRKALRSIRSRAATSCFLPGAQPDMETAPLAYVTFFLNSNVSYVQSWVFNPD